MIENLKMHKYLKYNFVGISWCMYRHYRFTRISASRISIKR